MAVAAEHVDEPRAKCRGRSKSTHKPCGNWPMYGQVVCRMHGGSTQRSRNAAKRRLALRQVGEALGVPKVVDPAEALLEAVYLAAGDVEFLQSQLPDDVVVSGILSAPVEREGEDPPPGATRRVLVGDGVDVRVKLYYDALDRMARLSKLALDAGIAERVVRMKEAEASAMVAVFVAVFDDPDLGLTSQQRALARQRARLLLLDRTHGPTSPTSSKYLHRGNDADVPGERQLPVAAGGPGGAQSGDSAS